MATDHSSVTRQPDEDTDTWLERVEEFLDYNEKNRATTFSATDHEAEVKDLGADRHMYVDWWDYYAVTEAMNRSAQPGTRPELVIGGPDKDGAIWVKIYRVIDPLPSASAHTQTLPTKILDQVVWYFEDQEKMSAFGAAHAYRRRPADPSAPKPIETTRDKLLDKLAKGETSMEGPGGLWG